MKKEYVMNKLLLESQVKNVNVKQDIDTIVEKKIEKIRENLIKEELK